MEKAPSSSSKMKDLLLRWEYSRIMIPSYYKSQVLQKLNQAEELPSERLLRLKRLEEFPR